MSQYDLANLIIAIIALTLSIIPLVVNLIKFFKNRLTTKTLQVKIENLINNGGNKTDLLHCDLIVTNHTRKEFTIARILLTVNGKQCKLWQPRDMTNANLFTNPLMPIPAIRLMAHDATILDLFIEAPNRINQITTATLSLITPYQRINYPVILGVDGNQTLSDNK